MMKLPIRGKFRITATFGQKGSYWANGHKGIDFVSDDGLVYAPTDSTVRVIAYDADGWGQYVSLGDAEGRRHLLCHMVRGSVKISVGQAVKEGDVIGTIGATGNVTGKHLHYELHDANGKVLDVAAYLGVSNTVGNYNTADFVSEEGEETMVYNSVNEAPAFARPTLQKLVDKKYLLGDENGNLNLSEDMMRILVILDRAKAFE